VKDILRTDVFFIKINDKILGEGNDMLVVLSHDVLLETAKIFKMV
jgi:hypothetical protein